MEKQDAVATLGESIEQIGSLLQPARVRAALRANDRLKLYLSVLQAAADHAHAPLHALLDLSSEIAAAELGRREDADWLRDLPAGAALQGEALLLPDLPRLARHMAEALGTMAQPLLGHADSDPGLTARVSHWQTELAAMVSPRLEADALAALTHGRREHGDSLHLTVMDLHKALNRLAAALATEEIDGAHVWQLAGDGSDRARVAAFMRGLDRNRALRLDHPGLDTAATREGSVLMIQNDIGTNDAHVLVLQVDTSAAPVTTLSYSDLHPSRFEFFQRQLVEVGAQWSKGEVRRSAGLNRGGDYMLGTARFEAADEAALLRQLEGIGEHIVFLIDWNRARKRLRDFVSKPGAIAVLEAGAAQRSGHMAWLALGGERLIWNAMAALGSGAFRLGDRLDEVLGEDAAREFLAEVLALTQRAGERGLAQALVADEVRVLLARHMQGRRGEFELLEEHAAFVQALAQGLRDGLVHGAEHEAKAAGQLAARAKAWERQADHLLMRARGLAERQPQWQSLVQLLERSDDVADALEEASFVLSLMGEHAHELRERGGKHPHEGWSKPVRGALDELAEAVLNASQDHVKALAIARTLGQRSEAADHDDFLAACWRVLQAERRCDELLRGARRALAQECRERHDAVAYRLGNEFAAALEDASDALLRLSYGLREHALRRIELVSP